MIQILGLIVGAILELHYGLPMSTYLWMVGISVAAIAACFLPIVVGIAKWGEAGGVVGLLIVVVGGLIFGITLTIAIGGALTRVVMGLI